MKTWDWTFWSNSYDIEIYHNLPIEPRHEISNNVVGATSKVSDQPAHTHSLIRALANRLNITLTQTSKRSRSNSKILTKFLIIFNYF